MPTCSHLLTSPLHCITAKPIPCALGTSETSNHSPCPLMHITLYPPQSAWPGGEGQGFRAPPPPHRRARSAPGEHDPSRTSLKPNSCRYEATSRYRLPRGSPSSTRLLASTYLSTRSRKSGSSLSRAGSERRARPSSRHRRVNVLPRSCVSGQGRTRTWIFKPQAGQGTLWRCYCNYSRRRASVEMGGARIKLITHAQRVPAQCRFRAVRYKHQPSACYHPHPPPLHPPGPRPPSA